MKTKVFVLLLAFMLVAAFAFAGPAEIESIRMIARSDAVSPDLPGR